MTINPRTTLLGLASSGWMVQALHAAAALDIAGHINKGARDAAALSRATGADEGALTRLLRALVTLNILNEDFSLTETGALLDGAHPQTLRHWVLWQGTQLWNDFGGLLSAVKENRAVRVGDGFAAEVFHAAMGELTRFSMSDVVSAYDFSKFKVIADIGGGNGTLLTAILQAYTRLSGILYDRVVPVSLERTTCIQGDFFESVPEGADLYILKSVLHDWPDAQAEKILRNCHAVRARLLLIERVMPERLVSHPMHRDMARADLTMLVAHGAKERSEREWAALLQKSGYRLEKITPFGVQCFIEAVPV